MLALTDSALAAVRQALAAAQARGLRIAVQSKGCAGLGYSVALEDAAGAEDEVIRLHDVEIFVDAASRPLLEGVVVDFVDTVEGAGFVFENPNATARCGCGKSFC